MKRVFLILTVFLLSISFYPVKALEKASDILKKNVVTTGDGLYVDPTENERYIYKGGNPNNFIKFNDELWRIISVEKDGSLKIIRANALDEKLPFNDDTTDNGSYCKSLNDKGYGCNAWAKMDYFENNEYKGSVIKNSTLNTYLNTVYYSELNDFSKKMIVNHDFGIGSYDDDYNYDYWQDLYNYEGFLYQYNQQVDKCNKGECDEYNLNFYQEAVEEWRLKVDAFNEDEMKLKTLSNCKKSENEYIWKGKIALANVSDILLTKLDYDKFWVVKLYGGAEGNWLMPSNKYKFTNYNYTLLNSYKNNNSMSGRIYSATFQGIDTQDVRETHESRYNNISYIRPVLYLNSNITIESGNGSENAPYVILYNESLADDNQNEDNSSLIVNVPSTSMFISIFVIGGFILIIIICLCIYLKVFKKKDIK